MKLLIDIGNTRAKWAVSNAGGELLSRGAMADGVLFQPPLVGDDLKGRISQVWVSCVGKADVLSLVLSQIEAELGLLANVVRVESCFNGLINTYSDLERLGVDRWVAAIGARSKLSQGSVIVVDAGTAVTIDAISDKNKFLGGVILPGMVMMHDSLVGKTAGIASELTEVASVIGKNTQECVNAGVQFGLIGAIEKIVAEMTESLCALGEPPVVMICGGDAARIQSMLGVSVQLSADLIFNGLHSISEASDAL